MEDQDKINKVVDLLENSDCVLIGAGAGLSADAGNDYTDKESFVKNYPELVKRGFQFKAQLMGYNLLPPELEWSYLARHITKARFQSPPQEVYKKFLDLIQDKDYFVITTNVDNFFVKNGFDENKVFKALELLIDSEKYLIQASDKLNYLRSRLKKEEKELENLGIKAYLEEDYKSCIFYMKRVQLINPENESVKIYLPRAIMRYDALEKFK